MSESPPFFAKSPEDLPDLATILSMSGREFMERIRDGKLPHPPIGALLDYHVQDVGDGTVTFRGTPAFSHMNPTGTVHGGWYGTLLDSCMSCAVMTALPAGSGYTTLEYKVNLVRAVPLGTPVLAIGTLDHIGRSTGVARGVIKGAEDGRIYATGTATCLVMQPKV